MEHIGLNQLREMFLSFYQDKEHYRRGSFSLVPEKDKSLLLINSGMAPLKPYFAGLETPPAPRMTTCQKCIRTGDIDNVGHTSRHGTFFEMLGSFSFGEYFKKESIEWGWEFMTEKLGLPPEKLWVTIYEDDDEAFELWKDMIGIPPERIVRLGKEDNFWEIGTGPCGPCSEIYYDRGEAFGCDKPDCRPGCDCDRFVEFWNHVFTQFNKENDGSYTPLAKKNIDTGMGLERLACIMQDVDSIFAVDTIRYILDGVVEMAGIPYQAGQAPTDISLRIITDHIRSVVFMIADGILPSNEGRGYVQRRLLRRAARHGRLLGIEKGFLTKLAQRVIETSGEAYPELKNKQDYIKQILSIEETKFSDTIDQGNGLLNDAIRRMKAENKTVLSGEEAFRLYDTYGFPIELTDEILREEGFTADEARFRELMQIQRETARAARKTETDDGWAENQPLLDGQPETEFLGYSDLTSDSRIIQIFKAEGAVDRVGEGETATLLMDRTPFYAEGGGQTADRGRLTGPAGQADVLAVSKTHGVFSHKIKVGQGELRIGDNLIAEVDRSLRHSTARNHTATHLLHKALKEVLGEHVSQAGSAVGPDSLRFDFSHFEAVSKKDLKKIAGRVNEAIIAFLEVTVTETDIDSAKKAGAVAQFDEKYSDQVRVVAIGDYSRELCGGTHVQNSGQIGSFKILSESGVAAGVRRIEAITGQRVLEELNKREETVRQAAEIVKANPDQLLTRLSAMNDEIKTQRRELDEMRNQSLADDAAGLLRDAKTINGIPLITKVYDGLDANELRLAADKIRELATSGVLVLASRHPDKVNFLVAVTDDLLEKGYHAGKIVKQVAAAAGGGGGGKADQAQAGGKDPTKIDEAFTAASEAISSLA